MPYTLFSENIIVTNMISISITFVYIIVIFSPLMFTCSNALLAKNFESHSNKVYPMNFILLLMWSHLLSSLVYNFAWKMYLLLMNWDYFSDVYIQDYIEYLQADGLTLKGVNVPLPCFFYKPLFIYLTIQDWEQPRDHEPFSWQFTRTC